MEAQVHFDEGYVVRRAASDNVILEDDRVLENLLNAEDRGHTSLTYLRHQKEISASMRKIVTSWMLEVSSSG